jgi:heavy metal translocating P-type ATPase
VGWHLAHGAGAERALLIGISVVVIACPCALGLATPMAILLATGLASRRGLLARGGDALEAAGRVGEVLLDKTGTVTRGRPALLALVPLRGEDPGSLLGLAAAVERRSEHHVGRAVLEAARGLLAGPEPAVTAFRVEAGRGVEAAVDGVAVRVGSRGFVAEGGAPPRGEDDALAAPHEAAGHTVAWLARAGRAEALLVVADPLRPEAPAALARLKAMGLAVTLVSGDAAATTRAVARVLGVEAIAEVGPEQKREIVLARQAPGRTVAFLGDGLNDAPALTQADLGVAMGSGIDVALESADAVLVREDLTLLPDLIRLGRRTTAIVRQNVFWAFFYNAVAVPAAVAGWLHPIVGAGAMALSSAFVVGNSLRLRATFERSSP